MYKRQVILACGLSTVKEFSGELENLGRGVSYCATCDGMLYKGKNVDVYKRQDYGNAKSIYTY